MRTAPLFALALLAACGRETASDGERKTAAGEVLGGTISDDMLPLDTVTSQSPPLREKAEGTPASKGDDDRGDTPEPVASEAGPEPSPSPTASATPEAEG